MNKLFEARYDEDEDALYIYLAPNVADGSAVCQVMVESAPCPGELILDFDSSGVLLGIEVLGAKGSISPELIASARKL